MIYRYEDCTYPGHVGIAVDTFNCGMIIAGQVNVDNAFVLTEDDCWVPDMNVRESAYREILLGLAGGEHFDDEWQETTQHGMCILSDAVGGEQTPGPTIWEMMEGVGESLKKEGLINFAKSKPVRNPNSGNYIVSWTLYCGELK